MSGAIQTIAGRTEPARSHRSLSWTFWAVFGVGLAVLFSGGLWLARPELDELDFVTRVTAAKQGPWLVLEGIDEERLLGASVWRQFLLDVDSGRSFPVELEAGRPWVRDWMFATDGSWLLGYQRHAGNAMGPVLFSDLQVSPPVIEETGWQVPANALLALRDDGSGVAILDDRLRLQILDPVHRRIEASWWLDVPADLQELSGDLRFLGPEKLRVTLVNQRMGSEAVVFDVDLQTKETRVLLRISGDYVGLTDGPSPVLVVRRPGGHGFVDVLRLESESPEVDESPLDVWIERTDFTLDIRSLGDSIAYAVWNGESWELRVLTEENEELTVVPFDGASFVLFAGLRSNEVLLCSDSCNFPRAHRLLRVSGSTGAMSWLDEGLSPLLRNSWYDKTSPGSVAARLLRNAGGDLVLLDTEGKIERVVVEGNLRNAG